MKDQLRNGGLSIEGKALAVVEAGQAHKTIGLFQPLMKITAASKTPAEKRKDVAGVAADLTGGLLIAAACGYTLEDLLDIALEELKK